MCIRKNVYWLMLLIIIGFVYPLFVYCEKFNKNLSKPKRIWSIPTKMDHKAGIARNLVFC